MSSYNLMKVAGREAMRADRQAELDATRDGSWPRDLNDSMRWVGRNGTSPKDWAAKMCRFELDYLADLERRLQANDPSLEAWDR